MSTARLDMDRLLDLAGARADRASVGLAAYRRHRRRVRRARWALVNGAVLGVGVVVVLMVTRFAFQFFEVPSASMAPTLAVGDRIFVQKMGLDLAHLKVGDIVVFKRPPGDHVDTSIADVVKRIVAVGGEVVGSAHGHLVVNGRVVAQPYLAPGVRTTGVRTQVVPAGDYFVMGDNRPDSYDSRFFGPIPASSIVGRVIAQVWPLTKIELF